jgi:hypothetical protein
MNLQTDQFRFKDRRNELTNRAVQFRTDADAVKDKLTHRSVHLGSDNGDTDELINISVHLVQSSRSRLVGNELTNRSVHFRIEKDKLTNISVQSLQLRETILQIDQIRSASTKRWKMSLQTDRLNLN